MAEDASLERTPTWAVAAVCAIFITVSILLEHAIHLLSEFLKKRKKKMLNRALYQIKLDLMLLGFISLLSTVAQQPTAKICIPKTLEDSFLPCKNTTLPSGIVEESSCKEKGKISLVSAKGIDQLQMLIFSLAFFHVISCLLTMGLGEAKVI
uniref:MLO-like protein 12 n=1 Tax=Anthurium amnicola TaxID=1678845 RepID=A0A1D1XK84_9ARAE